MLSTANYWCNAKELILRSTLHSSIHNHSRLFRTGSGGGGGGGWCWWWGVGGGGLEAFKSPRGPLFCTCKYRLLAGQICRANKHLVYCHIKSAITRCGSSCWMRQNGGALAFQELSTFQHLWSPESRKLKLWMELIFKKHSRNLQKQLKWFDPGMFSVMCLMYFKWKSTSLLVKHWCYCCYYGWLGSDRDQHPSLFKHFPTEPGSY